MDRTSHQKQRKLEKILAQIAATDAEVQASKARLKLTEERLQIADKKLATELMLARCARLVDADCRWVN